MDERLILETLNTILAQMPRPTRMIAGWWGVPSDAVVRLDGGETTLILLGARVVAEFERKSPPAEGVIDRLMALEVERYGSRTDHDAVIRTAILASLPKPPDPFTALPFQWSDA